MTDVKPSENATIGAIYAVSGANVTEWLAKTMIAAAYAADAVVPRARLEEAERLLTCGHHHSLERKSVESDATWCAFCECQSMQRDAEKMEAEYLKQRNEARAEIARLSDCLMLAGDFIQRELDTRSDGAFDENDEYIAEPSRICDAIRAALAASNGATDAQS